MQSAGSEAICKAIILQKGCINEMRDFLNTFLGRVILDLIN